MPSAQDNFFCIAGNSYGEVQISSHAPVLGKYQ